MKRFKSWLKSKIQHWLDISDMQISIQHLNRRSNEAVDDINKLDRRTTDLVSIGVDVHFKEPHMILIYSRLNGGQIREISARFDSLADLTRAVREIEERYGSRRSTTWDAPIGMMPMIDHMRKKL